MTTSTHEAVRPSWLLPVLTVGTIGIGLVLAGVISATTLVYVGVIGGMLFMHLGHAGHGAHVGHGDMSAVATTPAEPDSNGSRPATGGGPNSHSCH
jgi:hypothetical protein